MTARDTGRQPSPPKVPRPGSGAMLDAALTYAARGWHVFPLAPGAKVPTKGSTGHHDATTDADTIRKWWRIHPAAGVGISLEPSGLVVVDVDHHGADGSAALAALEAEHGALPAGPVAETPRGGRHLYFVRPASMAARRRIGVVPGVDLLAAGYVVAPPTMLDDGAAYRWTVRP